MDSKENIQVQQQTQPVNIEPQATIVTDQKSSSGFGLKYVVLLLILVGSLVGAGIYFYQGSQAGKTAKQAQTTTSDIRGLSAEINNINIEDINSALTEIDADLGSL